MKSFGFPKMLKGSGVNASNIIDGEKATTSNLRILLGSEKGEFFGDPFYGIRLKRYIYEQNSKVLKDIIIDEIYTQINVFMPQLLINRKDIDIIQERGQLIANIKVTNNLDYTSNTYSLVIFQDEER